LSGQHTLIRRLLQRLFAAIRSPRRAARRAPGCGHILLEGVPGREALTATMLAHAIARDFSGFS